MLTRVCKSFCRFWTGFPHKVAGIKLLEIHDFSQGTKWNFQEISQHFDDLQENFRSAFLWNPPFQEPRTDQWPQVHAVWKCNTLLVCWPLPHPTKIATSWECEACWTHFGWFAWTTELSAWTRLLCFQSVQETRKTQLRSLSRQVPSMQISRNYLYLLQWKQTQENAGVEGNKRWREKVLTQVTVNEIIWKKGLPKTKAAAWRCITRHLPIGLQSFVGSSEVYCRVYFHFQVLTCGRSEN